MSLKSISLAAVLVGAMFLVGCGDDDASGPVNSPPIAHSIAPVIIDTAVPGPYVIALDATDYDGNPLSYIFDNPSSQGGTVVAASGGLPDVEYTPEPGWVTAGGGVDSFTFYVSDGFVTSNVVTVYVGVDNTAPFAPSAVAGSPWDVIDGGTINEDTSKVLDLSILITDAQGDNVTYTFTDPANGALSLSGTDLTYSPDPDYPYAVKPDDTDSFVLTVSDMPGSENSYTVNVTVTNVNDPPVADDLSYWVSSTFTYPITLVGADIDGDGPLTYSIVGAPTKGTLGAVTGDQVDYTSFYGAWGTDTFTYRVNDGTLDSNVATVTIDIRLPDLTVTITSLPSSILVGDNFWLGFTVTNTGRGASPVTSLRPWIASIDGTWSDTAAGASVPVLAPGQSYSDSFFLTLYLRSLDP